ncbi:hypothetical protein MLD38_020154 [Melastoma candidum]|uniref:Uncharacterized protein n=1 Tax=Melastoma candidum TaxID=119954 RepID=A0ACB9QCZ9_9MYRT|nr:hypothetical protein MLD38_020154 [Melastoma candidum]
MSAVKQNENPVSDSKYTYIHDLKYPAQAVDAHHIEVQGRGAKGIVLSILIAIICSHYFCTVLPKVQSSSYPLLCLLFGALLMKLFGRRRVVRESVVIMPTLGVQLETLCKSGKTIRRFVPADVILKPVLQECVTPVACYWNLSLLLRGEEELTLVFKEVRPPLKILIPIWKALCAVSGSCAGEPDSSMR